MRIEEKNKKQSIINYFMYINLLKHQGLVKKYILLSKVLV